MDTGQTVVSVEASWGWGGGVLVVQGGGQEAPSVTTPVTGQVVRTEGCGGDWRWGGGWSPSFTKSHLKWPRKGCKTFVTDIFGLPLSCLGWDRWRWQLDPSWTLTGHNNNEDQSSSRTSLWMQVNLNCWSPPTLQVDLRTAKSSVCRFHCLICPPADADSWTRQVEWKRVFVTLLRPAAADVPPPRWLTFLLHFKDHESLGQLQVNYHQPVDPWAQIISEMTPGNDNQCSWLSAGAAWNY